MLKGYLATNVQEQSKYDTAVIKLPSSVHPDIGKLTVSTTVKDDELIQVVSYPGVQLDKSGYMYGMSGTLYYAREDTVNYLIDTEGGRSGGPVLDANQNIVGVHIAGIGDGNDHYVKNEARRIKEDTKQMIDVVQNNRPLMHGVVTNVAQVPQPILPTLTF